MKKGALDEDMKTYPSAEHRAVIEENISYIFKTAKKSDAAEYISAVKYFLDMNSIYSKTPSRELLDTIVGVFELSAKGIDGTISIKIMAYVYCQIFESANWLTVIYNLLMIMEGKCANANPFDKNHKAEDFRKAVQACEKIQKMKIVDEQKVELMHQALNKLLNPYPTIISKVSKIRKLSEKLGLLDFSKMLGSLYDNDFRNDFTHSTFVLQNGICYLIKAEKNITVEALMEILASTTVLYMNIGSMASDELEVAKKNGSAEYTGKHGAIKITFMDMHIKHESKMLCSNF
ncbi:MAG: hypothetical protein KA477_00900 [Candidatus Levybacteria bacterium]|nr:hypothetical protein [Candidatus Levybacteria bacterium]